VGGHVHCTWQCSPGSLAATTRHCESWRWIKPNLTNTSIVVRGASTRNCVSGPGIACRARGAPPPFCATRAIGVQGSARCSPPRIARRRRLTIGSASSAVVQYNFRCPRYQAPLLTWAAKSSGCGKARSQRGGAGRLGDALGSGVGCGPESQSALAQGDAAVSPHLGSFPIAALGAYRAMRRR
jgi:hypothetical protein